MYGWFHEELKQAFEDMYIRTYILDSIITLTEDFLQEEEIKNTFEPRTGSKTSFEFKIGKEEFDWNVIPEHNIVKIRISQHAGDLVWCYLIYIDPSKPKALVVEDQHKYNNMDITELLVSEEVFGVLKRYSGTIDDIVEQKKIIQVQFDVRTNPGMPCESTYVVDDFLHNFEMELSWMRSIKYVVERMDFEEFLKLEDQDLNYNGKLYRLADKSPAIIARLQDKIENFWMFGKRYRIENVAKNGLFYIENMDLQDVSECGYDTIDILCTGNNRYDVVELFIKSEENENVQSNQESN